MTIRKRSFLIVVLAIAAASGTVFWIRHVRGRTTTLKGAIITRNVDPRKQLPISDVEITATDGIAIVKTTSDSSGLFTISLPRRIFRGRLVTLRFLHMDYAPLEMKVAASNKIYLAEMVPVQMQKPLEQSVTEQTVSNNIVVRYTVKTATVVNVGSTVRSFEVANKGNVPCSERPPCSPDGKWKASVGSVVLDAGADNEFRNVRASCIAGPCPFTKVDTSGADQAARSITVTAMAWSDTATFLVEAEVVHPMISDLVRNSYPVIFGDALNFSLPPSAEGVSLQAELNGEAIVFPLGPALIVSWAYCDAREIPDQSRLYRCQLKPGYRWLHSSS